MPTDPVVLEANGGPHGEARPLSVDAFRRAGLRHLVHLANHVRVLSLDDRAHVGSRDRVSSNAALLCSLLDELDERLDELRMGTLIRTVLTGAAGSVLHYKVLPAKDIVAALPDARVHKADQAMAELTTALRRDLGLDDQNPGGFVASADPVASDHPVAVHSFQTTALSPRSTAIRDLASAVIDPSALQWVAYYAGEAVIFTVDCLDDPALADFHTSVTVESRRDRLRALTREVPTIATRCNRIVGRLLEPVPLDRVTFDPEHGALYYRRLTPGSFLLGMTLRQERVAEAETAMERLTAEVAALG
ncbi:hypothetical protein V5P93_005361 [Actinokineospora auranticolor]|uniref:Uncharacterized protein n=1 Tax=Actinokineospora auranticolor TaxID=155976 RepID=A0A2S6GQV1_9PSEU|nr:hypothetical protein [Actinokineospora auranticolor]PPK67612.1 hypothetical protein CLV40_107278 [Actinokineospora auranticolor]